MKPIIKPLGFLKQYIDNKDSIQVEAGNSIRTILTTHGIPSELVAGVFINHKLITKEYILKDDDVVVLMAVIGGG
jgi:sulfur carrier protein ThiS